MRANNAARGETFAEVLFGLAVALVAAMGAVSTAAHLARLSRLVAEQAGAVRIGVNAVESILMASNGSAAGTVPAARAAAALAPWRAMAADSLPAGDVGLSANDAFAVVTVTWRSNAPARLRTHLRCADQNGATSATRSFAATAASDAACVHLALAGTVSP